MVGIQSEREYLHFMLSPSVYSEGLLIIYYMVLTIFIQYLEMISYL